jgi:hypothetical protein
MGEAFQLACCVTAHCTDAMIHHFTQKALMKNITASTDALIYSLQNEGV